MDGKTLGVDENPHANDGPKEQIQEIILTLLERFQGQDVDPVQVAAALSQAIDDAGLPEQPQRWVESTAIEIGGGRGVIMHSKDQVDVEPE